MLTLVTDYLAELGERVRQERIRQRWTVKGASVAAGMARDTWKRIEAGQGVHDTNRQRALDLLGLDHDGEPAVAGPGEREYVGAPGTRTDGGASDDEVLRAIRAMRDDVAAMRGELGSVSERVARLEQRGAEPLGGAGGAP